VSPAWIPIELWQRREAELLNTTDTVNRAVGCAHLLHLSCTGPDVLLFSALLSLGVLTMHADDDAVAEEGEARAQAEAAALGEAEHAPAGHHLAAR